MSEEKCAVCGESKPMSITRQHLDGKQEPLCEVCSTRWLLSDENWPNTEKPSPAKKPYFGPFPQETKNKKLSSKQDTPPSEL